VATATTSVADACAAAKRATHELGTANTEAKNAALERLAELLG
jgi:gamma-glutamyl phosphate reductase